MARGVIGAVVTGHYPLNHHPARLAMEHLEQFSFGWKHVSRPFSAAQSVVFIASTIAVAVVVHAPCLQPMIRPCSPRHASGCVGQRGPAFAGSLCAANESDSVSLEL